MGGGTAFADIGKVDCVHDLSGKRTEQSLQDLDLYSKIRINHRYLGKVLRNKHCAMASLVNNSK